MIKFQKNIISFRNFFIFLYKYEIFKRLTPSIIKGVGVVAKKLGVSEVVKGGGYRSLVNVGENGGQEVPHLHFHIFGGEKIGKMVS